jgi:PEP-CTERM/exosortase A-associated glycosyltransferase
VRILHILDHSLPLETGYALRTQAILNAQSALGWETFHLTGPKQGPAAKDEESVDGRSYYRTLPAGGLFEGVAGLAEIELMGDIAYRIEQVIRHVRPHVLHAHSPILSAIPALRVGRRLDTPVVYEVRAYWEDAGVARGTVRQGSVRYRLMRAMESWTLKRVDAVTTICDGLRDDIVARGIPAGRVTVIANAAGVEVAAAGGAPDLGLKRRLGLEGALVLGFIGSFYAYEGLEVLLRALPEILSHAPQVRVLLVGDGPQEAELRRLTAELGVAGKVVFAARVPHAEAPRYYDLIDVLVCPRLATRHTEFVTPLKPLEAMARGCLLAASDVGGHRELIRSGETGVLFKAGEPAALAAAVAGLINAPERWPLYKAAARQVVETERTWAASAARYEDVYARITKQSWRA